jgi:hypothetical protein
VPCAEPDAVPADAIPYTKHSSIARTEWGHHVTFHGLSRVRWTYNGRPAVDEDRADVDYQFADAADGARFQEDVRRMDLLGAFDAETVRTHGDRGWGVASGQRVQLWRSREADGVASLSFFASRKQDHCEFPLGWFQRAFTADDDNAAVELSFVRSPGSAEADDSQTTVSRRRRLLRRLSGSSGSGGSSRSGASPAAEPSESPASVAATSSSSIGGSSGGSRSGPSLTHAQKMAGRARGFRYLRIEFAVPEAGEKDAGGWNPCGLAPIGRLTGADYDRFVDLLQKLMGERRRSESWSIAESAAEAVAVNG